MMIYWYKTGKICETSLTYGGSRRSLWRCSRYGKVASEILIRCTLSPTSSLLPCTFNTLRSPSFNTLQKKQVNTPSFISIFYRLNTIQYTLSYLLAFCPKSTKSTCIPPTILLSSFSPVKIVSNNRLTVSPLWKRNAHRLNCPLAKWGN